MLTALTVFLGVVLVTVLGLGAVLAAALTTAFLAAYSFFSFLSSCLASTFCFTSSFLASTFCFLSSFLASGDALGLAVAEVVVLALAA